MLKLLLIPLQSSSRYRSGKEHTLLSCLKHNLQIQTVTVATKKLGKKTSVNNSSTSRCSRSCRRGGTLDTLALIESMIEYTHRNMNMNMNVNVNTVQRLTNEWSHLSLKSHLNGREKISPWFQTSL